MQEQQLDAGNFPQQVQPRHALNSSETPFQALVLASSDMLYRMGPDWSELLALEGRGFIGDAVSADPDWLRHYIPAHEQAKVTAAIEHAIAARGVFALEHQVLRLDGTEGTVLSRAVPLFDAQARITEWFGAAMDLTARKRAEDELRSADRRKDEFLATLSHELRSPLAPLRNGLCLARRATPPVAPLSRTLEMMSRQLNMLVRLVDDLLDVSRINNGKVDIRRSPLVLQEVVLASLEVTQLAMEARGHALRLTLPSEPLETTGDFDCLARVFSNLLSNAIKYTDQPGTIEVRMACAAGEAVVTVADTGLGIAAADMPRIFDLFTQIPVHRAHADGGLGIGLSLVRHLVELHGGSVQVASAGTGRGSTFTVRLPLEDPRATMREPSRRGHGGDST